jgi:hypothetical protein
VRPAMTLAVVHCIHHRYVDDPLHGVLHGQKC